MTDMILTGPNARKTSFKDEDEPLPVPPKRARTSEDFYLFCKFILEYENYEDYKEDSDQQIIKSYTSSPLGSGMADQRSGRLNNSRNRASGSRHALSPYSSRNVDEYSVIDSRSNTSRSPSGESGTTVSSPSSDDSHGRDRFLSRSSKSSSSTSGSGDEEDKSSYGLITCFCGRPYAGRPMIECSKCLTWMHLSCVKIKKSNIPEEFFCTKCKKTMKNKNSGESEQSRTTLSRHK